uniref:Cytochrome P450 76C4 n=2 Tax=Cajanus cajan TaxID=3821 RepID=A0A151TQZ2_CAJCA|nr:Cytochrome P450 76C4 [Cajanus cajan]
MKALTSLLFPNRSKTNDKLPPGPIGLPIVGNLHQLGAKPHQTLASLANTYGPIMSLKLGQITTIVMSSVEMAKEVLLIHDQFLSNRKIPDAMKGANHDEYGLPFIPVSHRWRDLRKLCNGLLFSNKNLVASEGLRRNKVKELLSDIHQSSLRGEAVDIGRLAFKTTINLLSNTIYSKDLVHSTNKAGEIKELVANIMKEVGRPNLADCFPVLKVVDPHGIRRRTGNYFWKLLTIFKSLVDQRLKQRKDATYCTKNDMLDAILNNGQDNNQEMYKDKIERLSVDLFVAGTDTITSTVEWAMAELLHNPNIMAKAKAELYRSIGKGKVVEESDIGKLPYLQAIVKETFRLHPAAPLLLPRQVEVELKMHGYTIPKGAQVLVNVWAIGRDPNLWDNPCLFSPERFLGSEIDFRGRSFELTPFGGGRRICPGLPLAIRLLFLMLGSLINSFDWELQGGVKPHDMNMDDKFGLTLEKAQPVLVVPIKTTN